MEDSWYHLVVRDCLLREDGRELPIILLLGPPGTGKSAMVARIDEKLKAQKHRSPRARVNLYAAGALLPVSEIVAQVAHGLMKSSRIRLPRTVFTLHVLALKTAGLTDAEVLEQLDALLKGAKPAALPLLDGLKALLGMAPPLPAVKAAVTLLGLLPDHSGYVIRLLNRKGRSWLTTELPDGNLVKLARTHEAGNSDLPAEVLCKALVTDLRESYARRSRHPRNSLLLIEGAETIGGQDFLKALIAVKGEDPLVVVATSPTWVDTGEIWARPGLNTTRRPHPPTLPEARHADWLEQREEDATFWYPVLMPSLPRKVSARRYAPAIHRLTGGYRQATLDLLEWAGPAPDDDAFRSILAQKAALSWSEGLLLTHLDELSGWASARNLEDAMNALPSVWNLRDKLAETLWLQHDDELGTVIHPWLRQLLMRRLCEKEWDKVHERLAAFYDDDAAARFRHHLACVRPGDDGERLTSVVAWLDRKFDLLDANAGGRSRTREWIDLFNLLTTAPNRLPLEAGLEELHDALVVGASAARGDRTGILRTLVVNRWFWSDPLLDPSETRRFQIAQCLRDLSYHSTSPAELRREADRYEQR
ncbi:hypothetical protein [Nonomuraea typhae]|uniref:hypothetical protein n=1 Tax=Nonomuraea typhae TaxID=2603600 RepID=UPI0012F9E62B|nr:hypothetical protein [Nonomuraea typhae]